MIRTQNRDGDPAAARALADLATAAGASDQLGEALELRAPSEGEVPLSALDWLVLAAEGIELELSVVEAEPGAVPEWLGRDVPLLTTLEAIDEAGQPTTRWLVVQQDEEGFARLTIHDGEEQETRKVAFAELASELGVAPTQRLRWACLEPSWGTSPDAGASTTPEDGAPLHPLRRLFRLLKADRRDLLAVTVFAVAVGVLLLATPIAVQALVNFVALGGAIPPLIVVVALLFLGLLFAGVLTALQTWVVEILQRRLFVRAVADMAARLPRIALDATGARFGPELVNRYFDLETIQKRGSFLLLDGLSVLLSVLVGLVVLAFYHPLLLAFDILILAVIALIILGPVRGGILTAKAESSAKYEVAAWLEEIARNPTLFKASGMMKSVFERTDRLARNYVERRQAHFRIAFGQGVAALALQVIASTALLGIGGLLVIQGSLTLGQLVAAELILTLVVSSVAKMGKHLEAFYDLMAATDKVGALLDLPVESVQGEHHLPTAGAEGATLELRQLGWTPAGRAALFSNVSLKVGPGERIGIRGPSGVGKSTLLQLIWGLRTPNHGGIRIDGRDIRDLALESLRRTTGLIDRVEVFNGTVRENVQLERAFVSDEEVREALRLVGLQDDISNLPHGIDTHLEVDGRPFSAGQLVRLQVARAIASRPRLLLVSDFFEGLEERLREQIFDALFDSKAPWTLVFVSNSDAALARCDRTFLLDRGGLEEAPHPDRVPA